MNERNEKEKEFLQSLRNRPDKEPDNEFINRLERRLIRSTKAKEPRIVPLAVGTLALVTCLAVIFLLFHQMPKEIPFTIDNNEPIDSATQDGIHIAEQEQANVVLELPYGEGVNEAGTPVKRPGGTNRAMESFFVKGEVFYLLDNAARKLIVTTPTKHLFTIQLDDSEEGALYAWYQDVFVDDRDNIYVLDSSGRKVSKFNGEGNLLEVYPIQSAMMAPTTVSINEQDEILVYDVNVKQAMENLITGEVSRQEGTVRVIKKNEKTEEIYIDKDEKEQKIAVSFDHSTGGIQVLELRSNQIIFEKTEVADTHLIMAEFHVYVIDREGNVLGAVREPHEQSAYYSTHNLRMKGDKIYFLSTGVDSVVIYELIPGKRFEKKLQERIDEFLRSK